MWPLPASLHVNARVRRAGARARARAHLVRARVTPSSRNKTGPRVYAFSRSAARSHFDLRRKHCRRELDRQPMKKPRDVAPDRISKRKSET